MRNKIFLASLVAACVAGSAGSASADKIPNLVGTWTCTGPTVSQVQGQPAEFSTDTEIVRIDAQEGYGFHGVSIVEYDGAQHEEPFVGMISANKSKANFIESHGFKAWKIINKNRAIMEDDEYNPDYLMTRRATCIKEVLK